MSEPDEVRKAAAGAVADLTERNALLVADLAAEGLVLWDLRRDAAGTPRGRSRPVLPWDELLNGPVPPARALERAVQTDGPARLLLVNTFPDGPHNTAALDALRRAHPDATALTCDLRLGELLAEVVADAPLNRWYDLVTLQRQDDGRLELACRLLFPMGARRGERAPVAVECEAADERGTVFAVVSSAQERRYALVTRRTMRVPPGRYTVTAELGGPGRVRFHGLPAEPVADDRTWADLIKAIPAKLPPPVTAAHLVCAVEVSGPPERVAERLARAGQTVAHAAGELRDRLRVSLLAYGPHAFERRAADAPVEIRLWAGTADEALDELERLTGTTRTGYPRAAALECVLAEVAARLGPPEPGARTALLAIGGRPAFPPRVHPSEILPCPVRHDWAAAVDVLADRPGTALGAIHDRPGHASDVWLRLSDGAPADLAAVDVQRLGASLGLAPAAAQRLPFPLAGSP
ncbi:hypothetical protein BTM25_15860 [Actinomadura rubteroloni]|uniref:Uncharacterized protein n=1 Tax=Actinomadura rubteroloni TaxID=1926885 RepID=A0A2P4UQ48_9ACTN|nr:hypothetical protein [Actinomadura rubteroloni]POM27175.1 hypothetical protein BTM25_15860 [Actinomadura rubteroloni]